MTTRPHRRRPWSTPRSVLLAATVWPAWPRNRMPQTVPWGDTVLRVSKELRGDHLQTVVLQSKHEKNLSYVLDYELWNCNIYCYKWLRVQWFNLITFEIDFFFYHFKIVCCYTVLDLYIFPLPRYCRGAEVSHRYHQTHSEGLRCWHPLWTLSGGVLLSGGVIHRVRALWDRLLLPHKLHQSLRSSSSHHRVIRS